MPFGDYKDFAECVAKNPDKDSPEGWCAALHKKILGEWPTATKGGIVGIIQNFLDEHPDADISIKGIDSIVNSFSEWAGGDPGNFTRCVETLAAKPGITAPEALCAWLHQQALGKWPAEKGDLEGVIVLKSEAQRLVIGPVLVPGEPDSDGEVVSSEKIEEVALKFMEEFRYVDVSHTLKAAGVPVLSEILRRDEEFKLPDGTVRLPKGTWMLGVRVSDEAWPRVMKGELRGFSIMAIPRADYERIAAKGALPLGATVVDGLLKKTLLSDLGADWVVAAVSILERPAVGKSRYVTVKSAGLWARVCGALKGKEVEMTPEEIGKLVDERVAAALAVWMAEQAKKPEETMVAEKGDEKRGDPQVPVPSPPEPPAEVTVLKGEVAALKGELDKFKQGVEKIMGAATKSKQLSLSTPAAMTPDRDVWGIPLKKKGA